MRILLIDDSPAMRGFIRRVLQLTGLESVECMEASNGSEALQQLQNQTADVILCDINMPVMDGEQFMYELHARGTLSRTAVLMVSTDSTSTRMEKMMALGARGYLRKPFTPEALRAALETVLPTLAESGGAEDA